MIGRQMHRLFIFISILLASISIAWADDAHQAQVAAARASAIDRLAGDIRAEPIAGAIGVRNLIDQTGSQARLLNVLQQAQQIGGPRWIDPDTCQVRLDIAAPLVRAELARIASDNPQSTPLPAALILRDLKSWDSRVFSATGSSTGRIDLIRPPPTSIAWRDVSPEQIVAQATAARQDVVNRVLDSISSVPLAGGKTVGDALSIPAVAAAMADWVGNRPVTLVDFRDDKSVEVTLSFTSAALGQELRSLLTGRTDIALPADDKAWAAVAEAISKRMASPVGRSGPAAAATRPVQSLLPAQPPDWVDRQIDAQGTGAARTQLLSARAAEYAAASNLHRQIQDLPWGDGKTLGSAAARDPRLAAAIDQALARGARVYSVEYLSDGSATVHISLDLRDLWETISQAR